MVLNKILALLLLFVLSMKVHSAYFKYQQDGWYKIEQLDSYGQIIQATSHYWVVNVEKHSRHYVPIGFKVVPDSLDTHLYVQRVQYPEIMDII